MSPLRTSLGRMRAAPALATTRRDRPRAARATFALRAPARGAFVAWMVFGLVLGMAARAFAEGEAQKPQPAAQRFEGSEQIEITSTASSWDNLSELFLGSTPAAPFADGSVFVVRGEIRNRATRPVQYVVLRYELLDKEGHVLQDVEGYNRSAESMRPDEDGNAHPQEVRPIPAGGADSFRMVFFHDEVPHFDSHRVRVSEVHLQP